LILLSRTDLVTAYFRLMDLGEVCAGFNLPAIWVQETLCRFEIKNGSRAKTKSAL